MIGDDTHQSHHGGKRSTAGRTGKGLRVQFLASRPEPGTTVNLDRLRQEHAVSRSSLREAIPRRSSHCFTEIEKQRDTRVSPISPGNLSAVTERRMDQEPLALRKAIRNCRPNRETGFLPSLSWLNPTARAPKDQLPKVLL